MRSRLSLLVLGAVVLFAHTVQGQSLITPGSMPSAERIFADVKGNSPMDTAARQMGACWHLRQVVETLAGQRRFRNQLTAEERGLLGAYISGYQKAGAPYAKLTGTPEQPKWYQMHAFYETDDGFRDEVLERFVPAAIRDAYLRAKGIQLKQSVARGEAAQRERERVQVELKAGGPGSAAAAAAGQPASGWRRQIARCIAAGFSETDCMTRQMKQDLLPASARNKPKTTGLTISGVYSGQRQFSATFGAQNGGSVTCGDVSAGAGYRVERVGNALTVRLVDSKPADLTGFGSSALEKLTPAGPSESAGFQNQQIAWTVRPDGRLAGPASIRVMGNVPVGRGKGPMGEDITYYRTVTRTCSTGGVLTATGKATAAALGTSVAEGLATGLGVMLDVVGGNDPIANVAARVPDPGLRIEGQYVGREGFDLEFLPTAAVISCREAIIARNYTVSVKDGRVVVMFENGGVPLTLELRPDGTLTGPETVRVDGRVINGMDKNDQIVFQPVKDTCTVGVLTPVSR